MSKRNVNIMKVQDFNDLRTAPVGEIDEEVMNLKERVEKEIEKAFRNQDWWRLGELAHARRLFYFKEPVCILCNRFCYETSLDYAVCPKSQGGIDLMEDNGLMPSEVDWEEMEA